MQDKIIELLSKANGYVSGQDISKKLGVSRQAIWKYINALKKSGYVIDSVTNRGYRLVSLPNYLNSESISRFLKTKIIGQNLIVLDSVGSTNDYLKKLGNEGCPNGTVVAAREQTKGKGRLGRAWQTKKDDGITFSILLRPSLAPGEVSAITPLVGLAVCKAIREYTHLDCMIKWPNDIIIGKKKLVGILTEMSAEFDAVEYIITGIGINVNHTMFPEEISHKATSILLETGKHIDSNELFACVLKYIEDELIKTEFKLSKNIVDEYTQICATVGKNVAFQRGVRTVNGIAAGIESNGELKVMLSDGSVCLVNSGEVTVQGIY